MSKIIAFIRKETVLVISALLAIISAFFVHPDSKYIGYIDYRVLGILLSLMIVMAGFQKTGVFSRIGDALLRKTANVKQLSFVLIMLCFFTSMFITNDVALLTFVPFALLVLKQVEKEELLIPVIVLQTIAANLGSMLTPIGNPQNLYIYNASGLTIWSFMRIMLPYSVVAFVLLCICIFFFPKQNVQISYIVQQRKQEKTSNKQMDIAAGKKENQTNKIQIIALMILFLLCLLVVLRILPFYIVLVLVIITVAICNYRILLQVDYCLIFTFVFFFIFIGNMGRISSVGQVLGSVIAGHEVMVGILASQVVSNVPATLLLSGFTSDYTALLQGVNIGGLGTLIASMASLISYKLFAHAYNKEKGKFFLWFTIANIGYLSILLLLYLIM